MVAVQKYLHLTLCFELQSQHLCFLPKPFECLTLRHICPGINPYFRGGNTVGVVIANSKLHLAPWFTLQSQHYVLPQKSRLSPYLPQNVLIVTVVLNCDNFKENLLLAPILLDCNEGRSASTYLYDRMLCIFVEPCPDITWKGGT